MSFVRPSASSHHTHSHSSHYRPSARSTTSSFFRPSAPRSTTGSFFSRSNNHSSSSSYYKRRPRDGYIAYLIHKLKRLILDLWYYARRHPVKAFFAVVVPLISAGGAIGGLLRQFGVRVPVGLGMDAAGGYGGRGGFERGGGGGYYGSRGYESSRSGLGGFGGDAVGTIGTLGSLVKVAQAFM